MYNDIDIDILNAPRLLAGIGSIISLLAILSITITDAMLYWVKSEALTTGELGFSLTRLGMLWQAEPLLASLFVLGIVMSVGGALIALRNRERGAILLTIGFVLLLVPLVLTYVRGGRTFPEFEILVLLHGLFLINLSVTVDTDASRLPIVALVAAFVLSPVPIVIFWIVFGPLMSDVGGESIGLIPYVVGGMVLLAIFYTIVTVDDIDSSVTATGVFAVSFFGVIFQFLPDIGPQRLSMTDPFLVVIIMSTGAIIFLSSFIVDWRTPELVVSRRSVQISWGFVYLSVMSYFISVSSLDLINHFHPAIEPRQFQRLLWNPLATTTLLVFLITLGVAVWVTFGEREWTKT